MTPELWQRLSPHMPPAVAVVALAVLAYGGQLEPKTAAAFMLAIFLAHTYPRTPPPGDPPGEAAAPEPPSFPPLAPMAALALAVAACAL